jgi:hypothetical protein
MGLDGARPSRIGGFMVAIKSGSQSFLRQRLQVAILAPNMNRIKDRSTTEIVLFATAAFGVWVSIWAVVLVSGWLELLSLILTLGPVIIFALRDKE